MDAPEPKSIICTIPDTLPELQCMAVIASVFDMFLKPRENLEDAFTQLRVAEWVNSKYGVKPEHLNQ